MSSLKRLWAWWRGQFRKTNRLGKVAWASAPLVLGCCFCWTALLIVVPEPDVEPTAALAERTAATVEVAATQELDEATAVVEEVEPTQTTAPSRTAVPTRTAAPTAIEEPATATPRPSATPRPTSTTRATTEPLIATQESTSPTRALFAMSGQIDIIAVDPEEEYIDLQNVTGEDIMLRGWTLHFGGASEECSLEEVGLFPNGYTLRVWVVERPPTYAEHSCGLEAGTLSDADAETIVLVDADGQEIGSVTVEASSQAVAPTAPPQPTATLPTAMGQLAITNVNKRDEFVDIQNIGGTEVVLDGWTLRSEKGPQDCPLRGVLGPGQSLRIWAMSEDAGQGGFNCGMGSEIWNNSESDAAVLIDPNGAEVSRR